MRKILFLITIIIFGCFCSVHGQLVRIDYTARITESTMSGKYSVGNVVNGSVFYNRNIRYRYMCEMPGYYIDDDTDQNLMTRFDNAINKSLIGDYTESGNVFFNYIFQMKNYTKNDDIIEFWLYEYFQDENLYRQFKLYIEGSNIINDIESLTSIELNKDLKAQVYLRIDYKFTSPVYEYRDFTADVESIDMVILDASPAINSLLLKQGNSVSALAREDLVNGK